VADLVVIVPSRGRPDNIARVIQAWHHTGAFTDAKLVVAYDADDPRAGRYAEILAAAGPGVGAYLARVWQPMVPKLNAAAAEVLLPSVFAVGFAGDDHLPRTHGWAGRYLAALRKIGTGIVYGDDGLQGARLPTQWAMTADIVRALGAMVPAPVQHLYCDNAIKDLGEAAGCLRYLPNVLIEHMHPLAGKAEMDAGYARVNSRGQYAADASAYNQWREHGLAAATDTVRALRPVRAG
jgi:hypothetical protein